MKMTFVLIIAGAVLASAYVPKDLFGFPEPSQPAPSPVLSATAAPADKKYIAVPPPVNRSLEDSEQTHLQSVKQKLDESREQIEEKHSVQITLFGIGEDHILMQVRSFDNVEATVSEDGREALKQTLFDIAGGEFPLQLSVWECCTQPANVTGTITMYDIKQNRVLIVNEQKKNGNSDEPEATWVSLQTDALLVVDGGQSTSGLNESLVGRDAQVWTTGLMLQSYPGQASAIKLVVE